MGNPTVIPTVPVLNIVRTVLLLQKAIEIAVKRHRKHFSYIYEPLPFSIGNFHQSYEQILFEKLVSLQNDFYEFQGTDIKEVAKKFNENNYRASNELKNCFSSVILESMSIEIENKRKFNISWPIILATIEFTGALIADVMQSSLHDARHPISEKIIFASQILCIMETSSQQQTNYGVETIFLLLKATETAMKRYREHFKYIPQQSTISYNREIELREQTLLEKLDLLLKQTYELFGKVIKEAADALDKYDFTVEDLSYVFSRIILDGMIKTVGNQKQFQIKWSTVLVSIEFIAAFIAGVMDTCSTCTPNSILENTIFKNCFNVFIRVLKILNIYRWLNEVGWETLLDVFI